MTHGKKRLRSYIQGKPLQPLYRSVGSDYARSSENWNPSEKLTARPCDNMSCWIDPNDPDCCRTQMSIETFNRPVCKTCGITDDEKRHWYQLEPLVQKNIFMRLCSLGYNPIQFKDAKIRRDITTIKDSKQKKKELNHIAALFNVYLKGS
jgi:hypothetical protein